MSDERRGEADCPAGRREPRDVPRSVDERRTLLLELSLKAGEEPPEIHLAALQEDVDVLALRHAHARGRARRQSVTLKERNSLEVIREDARGG
jgi:hypothetical protein